MSVLRTPASPSTAPRGDEAQQRDDQHEGEHGDDVDDVAADGDLRAGHARATRPVARSMAQSLRGRQQAVQGESGAGAQEHGPPPSRSSRETFAFHPPRKVVGRG